MIFWAGYHLNCLKPPSHNTKNRLALVLKLIYTHNSHTRTQLHTTQLLYYSWWTWSAPLATGLQLAAETTTLPFRSLYQTQLIPARLRHFLRVDVAGYGFWRNNNRATRRPSNAEQSSLLLRNLLWLPCATLLQTDVYKIVRCQSM